MPVVVRRCYSFVAFLFRVVLFRLITVLALSGTIPAVVLAETDLTGVWVLLAHNRPGGMFGAPADPDLSAQGRAIVNEFQNSYSQQAPERGAFCVNSGMPESMFGIAGYPLDIIQTENCITLISEFQSEVRRVYMDGRPIPEDYPVTRNGYAIGQWQTQQGRDVLLVETGQVKAWEVDKWVHSDQVSIEERISLRPAAELVDMLPQAADLPADELVLENRITVTDPVMYDTPQSVTVWMQRVSDSQLLEYNCVEYNWRNALEEYETD